jgi:hypothetical protein
MILPFQWPEPLPVSPDSGHSLMALEAEIYQAYLDGSGKKVDAVRSLAAVAHFEVALTDFDADWYKAMQRYGKRSFHMCDEVSAPNSHDLIRDLINVMFKHKSRGLQFRACTVIVKDYHKAKEQHPTLRPLPAICANFCVGGLGLPHNHDMMLHFDRNEDFMHQVNRVWLHLKNKPKLRPLWVEQTRNILPVNSSYYGVQAADLIAWSLNRAYTHGDYEEWKRAAQLLCLPNGLKVYNYDAIVEDYANDKWS